MKIRKTVYPDDLESKVRKIAEPLGFEYTHIEMGKFPMEWYETYGYHAKDYIFDRFETLTWYAGLIKAVAMALFFVLYLIPLGMWLTVFGQLWHSFKVSIFGTRKERRIS